jgi:hypothetical protein
MRNQFKFVLLAASTIALTGCIGSMPTQSSSQADSPKSSDTRPCAKNFTVEGSAMSLSGKKYKTNAFVSGVSRNDAMTRASKKLAQDGLNIVTMDKEGGLLVASNKAIAGRGSQDDGQFVSTFEPEKGGLMVSMRLGTSFGQVASEDDMRENMCGVIAAISGKR